MKAQRAVRRKRNLVAKANNNKGGRHKTVTDYSRKSKHHSDYLRSA